MSKLLNTLERELVQLVEPIEKDQGKSFDTFIHNVNERVNQVGDQLKESNGDQTLSGILELMDKDIDRILIEQEQKVIELSQSFPKLSVLFELMSDTVTISPLVPMLLFSPLDYVNQARVVAKPMHRFKAIDALPPNEERANLVFGLYADVFEQSYKYYLDLVWRLCKITAGQSIRSKPRTPGLVIKALKEDASVDFQSLILPDSAMIRNAENHQESTRVYVPPTDSFRWLDNKKLELVHEHSVEYLLDSAKEMYHLGAEGMLLIRNYFTMFVGVNLYRDDHAALTKALRAVDQKWLIAHAEEVHNRILFLREPLKHLTD